MKHSYELFACPSLSSSIFIGKCVSAHVTIVNFNVAHLTIFPSKLFFCTNKAAAHPVFSIHVRLYADIK